MKDLKVQIEIESSRAVKLSQEAMRAFAMQDLVQGKALMKQAVDAGKHCQNLIQEYNKTLLSISK